jgi:hypothetical protein
MRTGDSSLSGPPPHNVPKKMRALQYDVLPNARTRSEPDMSRYSAAEKFAVVEINVPRIGDDDVLVR